MASSIDESSEVREAARRMRGHVLRMSHFGRAAHLGSSLSCVDILASLYVAVANVDAQTFQSEDRDRVLLSKGHAAMALYAALADRDFFPLDWLERFGNADAELSEQMSPNCAPGVEAATGSLGHGLPLAVGMALAARIQGRSYRAFAVLSDGECNEGSVWEAAMMASAQRLQNLTVIVDFNGWQATGRSREIMALEPFAEKWRAFGFRTREVDGHDPTELISALREQADGQPTAIVAHTVKGKGVSFMEDDNNWHYRIPNAEELHDALQQLGATS